LHDPIAVAAVLPNSGISWDIEEVAVQVVCHGEDLGRTLKVKELEADVRETHLGKSREQPKTLVRIPKSLDVDAFWGVVLEVVKSADGRYTWE
jgi:uridine nucleosidase